MIRMPGKRRIRCGGVLICFCRNLDRNPEREEYENSLHGTSDGCDCGDCLPDYRFRMVYLHCPLCACHVAGACQYSSGSGSGSGDGGEKAPGKNCKRYGGRRGSDRSDCFCHNRTSDFCPAYSRMVHTVVKREENTYGWIR